MPEVKITIGGRSFDVACQEGEQEFLETAAAMLDAEASVMADQLGRMPESRMLLMSGLLLADKTSGLEEALKEAEAKIAALESRPSPEPARVEVPVIPASVSDSMAELAARAEALAAEMEETGA